MNIGRFFVRMIPWIAGIVGLDLATGKGLDFFGLKPRRPKETAAALQRAAKPVFAPQTAEAPQAPAPAGSAAAPEAPEEAKASEIPDEERKALEDELKRCYDYDKLLDEKIAAVTGNSEKYGKIAKRAALEIKKIDGEIAEKKAALEKMKNTYKSAIGKGGTFAEQWTKVNNDLLDKISALEQRKEKWIMDADKLNWLQAEKARHARRIKKLEDKLGVKESAAPTEEKPTVPSEESGGPEKPASAVSAASPKPVVEEKPTADIPEWFDIASAEFAKTTGGKGTGQLYALKDKNNNHVVIKEMKAKGIFIISFHKAGEGEDKWTQPMQVTPEIAAKFEPAVAKACSYGTGKPEGAAKEFLEKFHALIKTEAPLDAKETGGGGEEDEDVLEEIPLEEDEPKQPDSGGGRAKPGDINV